MSLSIQNKKSKWNEILFSKMQIEVASSQRTYLKKLCYLWEGIYNSTKLSNGKNVFSDLQGTSHFQNQTGERK